ncbi:MAG: hypothetical protein IRY94_15100, partial [Rhodospirillaceae bacterium]|nr:hypothetical protein [Rhodospirillaceae bacterium]
KQPYVILVLYYSRGARPLRDAVHTHLYCWRRYSKYRFVYVNVAFGFPWKRLRRMRIAGIIYHTIFLAMRWTPSIFAARTAACAPLADLDVPKIALPQDEFIHTDMLAEFLERQKITHLLTCAEEADWRRIYGRFLDLSRVSVRTVLTGYIDERTRRRVERLRRRAGPRDIDIGYRAWKAAYWLGEHGQHKVRVAEVVGARAAARGLAVDSSQRDEDVLSGDDWFRFLLRCRATVGVEGGASVLDHDGSVKAAVEAYLARRPEASFEEVREACFPGRDHELGLACLSPRHLEACLTRTCQILVEGRYNGILQPWRHYIPVKRDYSDVERALDVLADRERVAAMVEAAHRDVVESGAWTYRRFVERVEAEVLDPAARHRADLATLFWTACFALRDRMLWRLMQLEVAAYRWLGGKSPLLRAIGRRCVRLVPSW